ncbi:cytochrome P450 [Streptomyces sp. NPDC088261]|uniref:cytochrome P450 n=1 Tax=Streptomyces sp. NPDC088261 TaxID=3365851 RepID=UPI0038279A3C
MPVDPSASVSATTGVEPGAGRVGSGGVAAECAGASRVALPGGGHGGGPGGGPSGGGAAGARTGGGAPRVPRVLLRGAVPDPYPFYRTLRERSPLAYEPVLGVWLVSRYDDVSLALTDPRFTQGHRPGDPDCAAHPVLPERGLGEVVERTAYVLARRIAGRGRADLVEEFCRWLPAGALATAVGGACRDGRDLSRLVRRRAETAPAGPCASRTAVRETALASFLANVLGEPGLSALLRERPALIPQAWAESLRRDPPVQVVLRRTSAEVELTGGTLPPGAQVACLIGAAGRDPARFRDPDRFDLARTDPGQLTFGTGSCPAVLLAGLEAEHGLRALLAAMPALRWADGFRPVPAGLIVRAPRTLLVSPGGQIVRPIM